jgi:type VI secretion system protein ImpC
MARDKIGSFMERAGCEAWLNSWIMNYCVDPDGASEQMKASRPLADAQIQVREVPGKPGWYEAVAHLRPHFQLETLTTSLRLVAEVPKKGG